MATLSSLDDLLSVAARLLDKAASEISEVGLPPGKDNIEAIGRALAIISDLQEAIYRAAPDLKPAFLLDEGAHKEADISLTQCMAKALKLEDSGDILLAIAEYEEFIALQESELHKRIAAGQLERLRQRGL